MTTRGNNPKTVGKVAVGQRLHENDLYGHLLRQTGWESLILPMEFEKSRKLTVSLIGFEDPRTEDGELLWPERFGIEEVKQLKLGLNAYGTAGQLQQRPAPKGGGLFRSTSFRYFDSEKIDREVPAVETFDLMQRNGPPQNVPMKQEADWLFTLVQKDGEVKRCFGSDCSWFQTIDLAMKVSKQHDYSVFETWICTPENDLLLFDVTRAKIEVPKQYDFCISQRSRFPLMFQAVEDKQSGTGVIQTGQHEGTPFKTLHARGDKYQRCMPISTIYDNGKVYHRRAACYGALSNNARYWCN